MAGAISFNVLIALFPLLVLGAGLVGFVLSSRFDDPIGAVVQQLSEILPDAGVDLSGLVEGLTAGLIEQRAGFTLVGLVFFVLLATRLVGTVRTALREIFDVGSRRGIVAAKLFDIAVVLVGLVLVTLNLAVTVLLSEAVGAGLGWIGVEGRPLGLAERGLGVIVGFASIWVLFLVTYRFLPARPIGWRTATVAATFTAAGHEVLKTAFSWYATDVASYDTAFGNLATVAVLFFWIYYGSLVFILGGEFAQVSTMRKASRVVIARLRGES